MTKTIECLLVSFDFLSNDEPIAIVGRKNKGTAADIINAIQGEEVVELYRRLTEVKEKKDE